MTVTLTFQPAIPPSHWQLVLDTLCFRLQGQLRSAGTWNNDDGTRESEVTLRLPPGRPVQEILQISQAILKEQQLPTANIKLETPTLQFSLVA